jgi:release factor glutamine methyltransferase
VVKPFIVVGGIGAATALVILFLRRWLAGRCTSKFFTGDVAVIVHYLAWGMAMLHALRPFMTIGPSKAATPELWWTWLVFGGISAAQQFFVLRDFQEMHADTRTLSADYGAWINMRVEVILRWTIIVALYLGVGEFVKVPGVRELDQFKYGTITVFVACLLWNIGALVVLGTSARTATVWQPGTMQETHRQVLVVRLWCFVLSSLFGALYWAAAIVSWSAGPQAAAMLLVIYFLLLVGIFMLRNVYIRARLVFYKHEALLGRRRFSRTERAAWDKEIEDIYEDMIQKTANAPHPVQGLTVQIEAEKEVYAPGFFTDSMWFAKEIVSLAPGKTLLEIGTGTGLIAIEAAKAGVQSCVATDINPHAVANAKRNVDRTGVQLQVEVREGDVFDALKEDERFDLVFWAHPFNWTREKIKSPLRLSGKDYRYRSLEAYLSGARQHVEKGGRILLGTGDSADVTRVIELALKFRMNVNVVDKAEMPLRPNGSLMVTYYLCEWVRWESP